MPTPCRSRIAPFAALLLFACGAKPAAVDLQPKSLALSRKGESKSITPAVVDNDNKPIEKVDIEWASADPKIVSVDANGKVSAVSTGTTTVSATVKGTTVKDQIVVSSVIPARIEADPATVILRGAGIQQDVLLKIYDDKNLLIAGLRASWVSDNPAVATAANGVISGVADGTATITATASDASVRIPVQVKGPQATTVSLDPDKVVVKIGATEQLGLNVIDDIGQPMPNVTAVWGSSDPGIATVSESGLVTGVRRGNTLISATVGNAVGEVPVGVR